MAQSSGTPGFAAAHLGIEGGFERFHTFAGGLTRAWEFRAAWPVWV
ncbi:MAG: hypothetical protein GDA41_06295 [Rhodospirillales bacterium]|nr:hypothetical protein [Rhodospirillales bacterium]